MTGTDDWARTAVERLAEDEALRGDLSDAGFGPLLDWGVAAVLAYAAKATDAAAMERYTGQVRRVIRAAVTAAAAGELADARALLEFETDRRDEAAQRLAVLDLAGDADANAGQIAALLQAALQPAPVPQPARRRGRRRR
jgi:hypothetical protein